MDRVSAPCSRCLRETHHMVHHAGGYISLVQRDAMADILDAGHAAMHRAYEPSEADLNTALDITEGIFAAIYVHADQAKSVASRLPARPLKPPKNDRPKQ